MPHGARAIVATNRIGFFGGTIVAVWRSLKKAYGIVGLAQQHMLRNNNNNIYHIDLSIRASMLVHPFLQFDMWGTEDQGRGEENDAQKFEWSSVISFITYFNVTR